MFVDVFIKCVAWSYWRTWCVLLIIWILYYWSFDPLVSFWSYCFIMSKKMHLIQKGDSNLKHLRFFVFYFSVLNKISSTPSSLYNFQEFFKNLGILNHWVYHTILSLWYQKPFLVILKFFEIVYYFGFNPTFHKHIPNVS